LPSTRAKAPATAGPGFIMSPIEEPSDSSSDSSSDSNGDPSPGERSRERFRKMLREGKLDDRFVEVEVATDSSPMLQVFGPMGMEEMGMNLQELFGNMGNRKKKKRRVPVNEALDLLAQEEAQKLIDIEEVKKDARNRVQQSGIVFIDEIDKVAGGSSRSGG